MSSCLSDQRVTVFVGDGIKYVEEHKGMYDVIITDSSDPIGPGVGLFQEKYFRDLKAALKPSGIICSQGESIWFDLDLMVRVSSICKRIFHSVSYASIYIPTYTGGQIGLFLCSDEGMDFKNPVRELTETQVKEMKLKYYNPEIHGSSFVVPQFVKEALSIQTPNIEDGNVGPEVDVKS